MIAQGSTVLEGRVETVGDALWAAEIAAKASIKPGKRISESQNQLNWLEPLMNLKI
jgi:hypothetical protein